MISRIFDKGYHPECVSNNYDETEAKPIGNKSNSAFKIVKKSCSTSPNTPKQILGNQNDSFESHAQLNSFTEGLENKEKSDQLSVAKESRFENADNENACLNSQTRSITKEGKLIGFYTQRERRHKINQWRARLTKHKKANPINKLYKGRSNAARSKVRLCGKFVKSDIAEKYAIGNDEFQRRNTLIDKYLKENDFEKAVGVLVEY